MNTDQHFWSLNQCLTSNKLCDLMIFLHLFKETFTLCSLYVSDALFTTSADCLFMD